MQAFQIETTLDQDGVLNLNGLPFQAGDRVEVIVLAKPPLTCGRDQYPLWGTPYRYDYPTEPVAEEDWEALQ
jgi:hypothetical protein